ncbi:MAG TPA: hypothetical protein VFH29_04470 [Anaerolineales bacterium]|nr:hypothetical protein [Anaerolineales bacterium]
MMRLTSFAIFAASAILLSSCGSTAPTAQPTTLPLPTATAMPPTAAPTQTEAPTAQPTSALPAAGASTIVNVTLVDNSITSSLTTFKAGTPYTFVIKSNARHEHNFVIAPPVSLAGGYAEALGKALLAVDETQVPPGGSFSMDFTFPESAVGATLEFSCLIKRHYEDGMRLDITVTK